MMTDTVQTLFILPLLAVAFVVTLVTLGGTGSIYRSVATTAPELLAPGYVPGLQFGLYVVVAVLGAEMLNQAWWQRVYAARDPGRSGGRS